MMRHILPTRVSFRYAKHHDDLLTSRNRDEIGRVLCLVILATIFSPRRETSFDKQHHAIVFRNYHRVSDLLNLASVLNPLRRARNGSRRLDH